MEEEQESKAPSVHTAAGGGDRAPHPPMEVISHASAVSGSTYMHQRRALFQNIKQHDLIGFDDIRGTRIFRPALAEFLGTLILVFVACGSCAAMNERNSGINIVSISLAFGLTVATVAQAIGHVSGAHLNPAVSFGLIPARNCSIMKALVYSAAQCSGALVGALLLWIIMPGRLEGDNGIGTTTVNALLNPESWINKTVERLTKEGVTDREILLKELSSASIEAQLAALLIEFVITFVLVLLVCGVCDSNRNDVKGSAALAVGLAVAIGHLFAVPFCGPSMNPARSIGPAVVALVTSGFTKDTPIAHIWVYIFGPIGGGLAAGLAYRFIFKEKAHEDLPAHPHTA